MLIILLVATVLFVLAWFYLLPHYNGNDYTFWIGKTYTRQSLSKGTSPSPVNSRRAPIASRGLRPIVEEENREAPSFVPASSFQGAKPGYVFKNDRSGLGYYVDEIREKPRVRFSAQNQMQNYRTGEPPNYVKKGV